QSSSSPTLPCPPCAAPFRSRVAPPRASRRAVFGVASAAVVLAMMPGVTAAQSKVKVAAIYTVPVEQQWVSRIHKALNTAVARGEIEYKFSENVANTDYERVMRQYAEQGHALIVGEAFAVEPA